MRSNKRIVILTAFVVLIYAAFPFIAGMLNTGDCRGPLLYNSVHHSTLYRMGYYVVHHGKPREPHRQRTWFYGVQGVPLERMPAHAKMQCVRLGDIQSEIGLVFPTNSVLVRHLQADVVIDPVWVAKVMIPPSSFESFAQILRQKKADDTVYHGALADTTSWWTPTNIVMTQKYLADKQTFVNVVVAKEVDGFAVYIECAMF